MLDALAVLVFSTTLQVIVIAVLAGAVVTGRRR
jgi:hypothetical protein